MLSAQHSVKHVKRCDKTLMKIIIIILHLILSLLNPTVVTQGNRVLGTRVARRSAALCGYNPGRDCIVVKVVGIEMEVGSGWEREKKSFRKDSGNPRSCAMEANFLLPTMLNPPPTPGLGNVFWVLNRYSSKIKESDSASVSQMQGLLAQH